MLNPCWQTPALSRPTGFPQINPTVHNPLKPCIACHNPHDPVPPPTPRACSACHAQIERTKTVSSHALLVCTTCHTVSEQHKKAPRTALPSKPQTREFCAKCHGKDALQKEPSKIDVTTHGTPYLCWQCHFRTCRRDADEQARLLEGPHPVLPPLGFIAYNLGNLLRRLALPLAIQSWSLTSLQQRVFKTGGRLIRHARYFILQLAESYLTQRLFRQILGRSSNSRGTRPDRECRTRSEGHEKRGRTRWGRP